MAPEIPFVEKHRPRTLEDIIGNYGTVEALRAFAKTGEFPLAMILWGPFGSGKTTAAKGVVRDYLLQRGIFEPPGPSFPGDPGGRQLIGIFSPIKFVAGGTVVSVDIVRGEIARFMEGAPPQVGIKKFVIIDEGDKLSHEAQGALQTLIEARPGTVTIWTTNYLDRINPAIRSRAAGGIFELKLPARQDIAMHLRKLASKEKVEVPEEIIEKIVTEAESVRDAVGLLGTEIAVIRAKAPPPLFPPAPPPPPPPIAPPTPYPPPIPPEKLMVEELNRYIRERVLTIAGLEEKDILLLTMFIDPTKSMEWNRKRIDDQIIALTVTRAPRITPPPTAPPPVRRPPTVPPFLEQAYEPAAVRVKVTYPDGTIIWSGVVAISTGRGIRSGTLRLNPDAKVEFFPA